MRTPLTVAAAQPPCVSHDVTVNAVAHADAIRRAGARVVVFPELSLTGYELMAPTLTAEDPRLAPVKDACAETGSLALLGAPVQGDGGSSHIGVLAVEGDRAAVVYRKMWLGGAEVDRFSAGGEPVALDVDGWRLGLAVCKDTGIAQHAADTAALGIDVYVAGVLEHDEDAAVQPQRARRVSRAHHVWVVVASFAGATGGGFTNAAGQSAIWNPDGDLVERAGTEPGAVVRATLT